MPRVYISDDLREGGQLTLADPLHHRLRRVLRLRDGARIELFNERQGSWTAQLQGDRLKVLTAIAPARVERPMSLAFAPIKGARQAAVIEKATELGVTAFVPIHTARTVAGFTPARFSDRAIAAAEQCGRHSIPVFDAPIPFADWQPTTWVVVCAEWGPAHPMLEVGQILKDQPVTLFIGPEGGLTLEERARLETLPQVYFASLGSSILRADTAAVAALALWRCAHDRDRPPRRAQALYAQGPCEQALCEQDEPSGYRS
ncbi:MAG: RsmE family RNA methyltransferase [Pseudomonadota bacterium]